ncbi:hypothetical protein [Microbispora sp. GKU 823]|uniref:hypothetical protein n=1 Tax=Microbispora sp. GKU 823 TaxID=1652100 RepID=UPI0009A2F1CE|nr:hypothetical protein [Microbispora sp. GKU 823]OPG13878.1 hypothetical protein B1L11_05025 [Microbispora sp. GKU 823]
MTDREAQLMVELLKVLNEKNDSVTVLMESVDSLRRQVDRLLRRSHQYAPLPEREPCPVIDLRTRARIA